VLYSVTILVDPDKRIKELSLERSEVSEMQTNVKGEKSIARVVTLVVQKRAGP